MLKYGYNQALPEGTETAWGARAIINQDGTVDLVSDRQSTMGTEEAVSALLARLNGGINAAWLDRARALLRSWEMNTRKAQHFILYTDEHVTVVANTNASAGYLYVSAYATPTA